MDGNEPIPHNPNLALPQDVQQVISSLDNERYRTHKPLSQLLIDTQVGHHSTLFRQLLRALEPKSRIERKDMEDAMGSVEYLFALGLDPKGEIVGSLTMGNTDETLIAPTERFVRGYLDENQDRPTLIHYHGEGLLTAKVVPFFSSSDLAFAVNGSLLPLANFALHTQRSSTVWVIAPFPHLKPYGKTRHVHPHSAPTVMNPENPRQLAEASSFLRQHGHVLYKTDIKAFNAKLEMV